MDGQTDEHDATVSKSLCKTYIKRFMQSTIFIPEYLHSQYCTYAINAHYTVAKHKNHISKLSTQ
jgi:hypothetical protein